MADFLQPRARPHPLLMRCFSPVPTVLFLLCAAPLALAGQTPGPERPRTRVGFPLPGTVQNRSLSSGARFGLRSVPVVVAAQWVTRLRARIAAQRADRRGEQLRALLAPPVAPGPQLGVPPAAPPPGLGPLRRPDQQQGPEVFSALGRYADLGLQLTASFQMKMDQLTNERCTVADAQSLTPGCQGGFPTPAIDQQFNIRAGGIIGERVHLNVDFDTEREFTANNNINVYYQGLEDEIVRRVEIGNVSFSAPASRFITAAIPANSFGVQAQAQIGAFEFNAIVAQQKGSQLRTRIYTVGETTTEPTDRETRDLDYERGRFFAVLDPRTLPGYPETDLLNPAPEALSPTRRPVQVRVYRLRAQTTTGINPNLGGVDAIAIRDDSPQRVGPFPWEILIEGRDYFLDPSGLWFALQSRVGDDDFLAVSYVTASGDTVGTFPAVSGTLDTLFLLYEPRRGPESPTFHHELRNVYRVGGSDVDRETLSLTVVINESERPLVGGGTYLDRLGLAQNNDPTALDQYNRVFPRAREPNLGAPIRDLFVVFPHLLPLADDTRLTPGELNDSLYRTPTYLLSSQGPPSRARLRFHYEAVGGGDRTTLSLGAFQIREASEKIYIQQEELTRDRHYQINYEIGQITFLNPDSLFRGPTQIRAQFEENQLFDVAPKSILGLTTRYDLGSRGAINVIGMFQRESSQLTRPTLGFEPQANFIGGVSTQLLFRPDVVTRALNALPFVETSVPSTLTLNGELAFSRPNPNSIGAAWIEEFENAAFRQIPLVQTRFQTGSRPTSGRGLPITHLNGAGGFAAADAVPLVWQNVIQIGNATLEFGPRDIDSTIVIVGSGREVETVLWFSLKPDTVAGAPDPVSGFPRWTRPHIPGPRWRSVTQSLNSSGIGVDLSRTEFLEFWVLEDPDRAAQASQAVMVLDFGTVLEDAVAFGPTEFVANGADTLFSGFQFIGLNRLDTERDSLTNLFNAGVNDRGILGDLLPSVTNSVTGDVLTDFPLCSEEGFGPTAFPRGDLASNCTRGNGAPNTEDLNNDNRLDVTVGTATEDLFRYVFPIGDDRYFVRAGGTLQDTRGRDLVWRLYRIPFREDTLQVGTPNLRQIQALRMTIVAPDQGGTEEEFFFALARMRLVGAPWLKRAATPIAGLGGQIGEPHGEVVAAVVTTENRDLGYSPPPGVFNQAGRRGAGLEFGTQQVNETSLRLLARDLRQGERAEAFLQFQDQSGKNFLRYRTLRVWARGRGPGWEDGDLEFFVKVGRDEDNFYLYRTPARTVSWEPEVVVDMERWLFLRAEIEVRWLRGDAPDGAAACGAGDSLAYVACDGHYLVQVRDPGISPPNLARVTEIAVGMYRVDQRVFIGQAEVWVDDIRLTDVVDDVGVAGAVDVRLQAADVGDLTFGYQARDANFQQLGQDATFVTNGSMRIGGTLRADKFLPAGLGLNLPVTIQHTRSAQDPFYLDRTDLRADALTGLRRPEARSTAIQASLRRVRRGNTFLERLLVDPWNVSVGVTNADATQQLGSTVSRNRTGRLEYRTNPGAATTAGAPGFFRKLIAALPAFISESEFGQAAAQSRLRVNPFQVRGAATLTSNRTSRTAFRVPVALESDSAIRALSSQVQSLRAETGLDLRPYSGLGLRMNLASTRNLRDYGDTTTLGRVLAGERRSLLGRDVGFEQNRAFTTAFNLTPVISSWFRPRLTISTGFTFNRDPNGRNVVRTEGDTAGAFRPPETILANRRREIGASLDGGRLARNIAGTSLPGRLLGNLLPLDATLTHDLRSSFDRPPFGAPLSFQFALGGIDDFRARNGVLATSAGDVTTRVFTGGTRLPLGFTVRSTFRDQTAFIWSRRFGTPEQAVVEQRSREWPSGSVNWLYTPRWALKDILATMSAGLNFRVSEASTLQPSVSGDGLGSRTETHSSQFAPTVALTFRGGIVTSAQYGHNVSELITSGNTTSTERNDWRASVNFRFRPPRSLVRLPNDIQATVTYNSSATSVCLLRADATECAPVSESIRRAFDLRMDTGFSTSVRGGASLSYIRTEQVHLSSRVHQVTFTVFAEVFFVTGQLR